MDKRIKALKLLSICVKYNIQLNENHGVEKYNKLKKEKENLDRLKKKYDQYGDLISEIESLKKTQQSIKDDYGRISKTEKREITKINQIKEQRVPELERLFRLGLMSIAYKFEQLKSGVKHTRELYGLKKRFTILYELNMLLKNNSTLKLTKDELERIGKEKDDRLSQLQEEMLAQKELFNKMKKWQALFAYKSKIKISD